MARTLYTDFVTTKPATDSQFNYLRGLLAARDVSVHGVTDIDALFASLRTQGADTRILSKMIDVIKALPLPAGAALAVRANRYAGRCRDCGGRVAEGAGRIEKNATGRWDTIHLAGQCPVAAPAPADLDDGLYMTDEGKVYKLYTTQNDRQACKRLVVIQGSGSFDYVPGGVRRVRDAVAAGTARPLTQAEATAFGKLHGFCVNCARDLDDERSLAMGYGPVCAKRYGWFYPTTAQAAEMLARPTEAPMFEVVAVLSPEDVEAL